MQKIHDLARTLSGRHLLVAGCAAALLLGGCAPDETAGTARAALCQPPQLPAVDPPAAPACDNDVLAGYDGLLVIGPHPDDEVLGFSGLISAYLAQGKPVEVIVATDGDAYCEACRFWKSSSVRGPTCSAEELSNFATPAIDSFAEVRRGESATALGIVGAPAPTFLGYPDTGLAAAWQNSQDGELSKTLRRSDFSKCESCETCSGGYGEGPETELDAASLIASLSARLAATSENTLLATTHWLDGHGDHAALGNFVKTLNAELDTPRPVAYAVIHAHTPKTAPHPDCWYPGPEAPLCRCMDEDCAGQDPQWISRQRDYRYRPEWPAALPDDADYGDERQLCLAEELYQGDNPVKLAAVNAYQSQMGFLARQGSHPENLAGMLDCSGYLIAFVRRTEAFVLIESPGA